MKEIEGFENYSVTEDGRIFNNKFNKFLRLSLTTTGYLKIGLNKGKERKFYGIHRLVAIAFIPNPDNHPVVMHLNNIKTDNRVENLKWGTYTENAQSAWDDGLCENSRVNTITSKSKPVLCVETGEIFPSSIIASREIGVSYTCVSAAILRGGSSGGYHWCYLK